MDGVYLSKHSLDADYGTGNADNITIAFVNNMPDAAVRSSERQFYGLLKAGAGGIELDLRGYVCLDVPRSDIARQTFLQNYRDIEELFDGPVDGLIVTGAEPRGASLPEEPFWPCLARLVDWAEQNTISAIWSCLAAHAAAFRLSGVARKPMPDKLSGLYECSKTISHLLTAETPQSWRVPHSRYNDLPAEELQESGFQPVTSIGAWLDTFVNQNNSMFVFFQGHPEYEAESLLLEYMRDVKRFIEGHQESYPNAPVGYFSEQALAELEELRQRALKERKASNVTAISQLLHRQDLKNTWRPPSTAIFRNWLKYIAEEKRKRSLQAAVNSGGIPLVC